MRLVTEVDETLCEKAPMPVDKLDWLYIDLCFGAVDVVSTCSAREYKFNGLAPSAYLDTLLV